MDDLSAEEIELLRFIAECGGDKKERKEYPLHFLIPPSPVSGWFKDPEFGLCFQDVSYPRRYPFIWHACQYPDRPLDEMCLFDRECEACNCEWEKRGCPVDVVPPMPGDAPVLRELVYRPGSLN